MESIDDNTTTQPFNMDDLLLEFSSTVSGAEDDFDEDENAAATATRPFSFLPLHSSLVVPDLVEEELEWISNKDAFPMVESLADIIPCAHPSFSSSTDHLSPVSVLENSSSSVNSNGSRTKSVGGAILSFCSGIKVPVKARSNQLRKKRKDMVGLQIKLLTPKKEIKVCKPKKLSTAIGRKCQHCLSETTPQWRLGPNGPKTLCNACGVRYKSGRLVPEYRPANSPTFSSKLHSNSHRKIMEMRKKQMMDTGDLGMLKDRLSEDFQPGHLTRYCGKFKVRALLLFLDGESEGVKLFKLSSVVTRGAK
ncbi:GATA transcription factor 1-like protein [Drosera capensis]